MVCDVIISKICVYVWYLAGDGAVKGDGNVCSNEVKNCLKSIRFGSALGDACDEIIDMIEKDLNASDRIKSKMSGNMDSNMLTLLFVFAVLRNSLASMLRVVSLMVTHQIGLSSSAEPFLRYIDP